MELYHIAIKSMIVSSYFWTIPYDPAGRIHKVERLTPGAPVSGMPATHYSLPATADETYTYAYLPDSHLIATVTGPQHTVLNTYEPNRDVLIKKENKVGTTTISQHVYTVNAIGQRTVREQTGSAFVTPSTDAFAYNVRGEVVASTNTQRPTLDTAYNYDGIGNRLTSQDGLGQRNYTANALNQYTHVGAPPATPTTPAYDLDGNMTSDGLGRTFTWDAENRLVTVETDTTRVAYAYDGQSRRVRRTEFARGNPLATWEQTADRLYLYDGWNVLAEYTTGSAGILPVLACSYIWGLDLSGSHQDAGGVGGLLSVKEGEIAKYYTFDGNGNVSELLDAGGNVRAHYEYDPFGSTTVNIGEWVDSNTWRFSTKPFDTVSGLYYYGYRFYDSVFGRWISRDPIEENGGVNLYAYINNNTINANDPYGLWTVGIGIQGQAGVLFGVTGSFGFYFGKGKNGWSVGFLSSFGGGYLAGVSDSIGGFIQATNADNTGQLKGPGREFGASVGAEGPSVGGDYIEGDGFKRGQLGVGIGVGIPAEGHLNGTYTIGPVWGSGICQ
jgi:RHS repeat-associated protein